MATFAPPILRELYFVKYMNGEKRSSDLSRHRLSDRVEKQRVRDAGTAASRITDADKLGTC
jgi:hypothetical protein